MSEEKQIEEMAVKPFGRLAGVSHTAVQKAIKDGRIPQKFLGKSKRGHVTIKDPQGALAEWKRASSGVLVAKVKADITAGGTLGDARVKREFYNAELAKLDFETRSGKLVEVEKVNRMAFNIGRQLREAIMNIPARISGTLASEKDPFKVEEFLRVEFTQALEEMAEAMAKLEVKDAE